MGESARREQRNVVGESFFFSSSAFVVVVVAVAAAREQRRKALAQINQPLTSAAFVPACARSISSDDSRGLRRRHGKGRERERDDGKKKALSFLFAFLISLWGKMRAGERVCQRKQKRGGGEIIFFSLLHSLLPSRAERQKQKKTSSLHRHEKVPGVRPGPLRNGPRGRGRVPCGRQRVDGDVNLVLPAPQSQHAAAAAASACASSSAAALAVPLAALPVGPRGGSPRGGARRRAAC